MRSVLLAFAILFGFVHSVTADVIVSPANQYFSNFTSLTSGFNVSNLINQTGFTNTPPFQSGVTIYETAIAETHRGDLANASLENEAFGGRFPTFGGQLAPGSIRLDLGESLGLTGIAIWNVGDSRFPSSPSSAMREFRLRVSDDSSFSTAQQVTFANNSITETASEFSPSGSTPSTPGENFDFDATYFGRFVELRIFNSHALNDTVFVGEVAFSAIPEPQSLLGVVALGLALIRRRR